jgi:periplasmic protein CpxP/Spy
MIRKLLLTALLTGLAASVGSAQSGERADVVQQRLAETRERLKLTPEQEQKVVPILREEMQQLRELRDSTDMSSRRDKRRAGRKLRDIQNNTDDKLKDILSKEQMKELKRIREERREQMRQAR